MAPDYIPKFKSPLPLDTWLNYSYFSNKCLCGTDLNTVLAALWFWCRQFAKISIMYHSINFLLCEFGREIEKVGISGYSLNYVEYLSKIEIVMV